MMNHRHDTDPVGVEGMEGLANDGCAALPVPPGSGCSSALNYEFVPRFSYIP